MTDSEIGELLADLSAIGTGEPTPLIFNLPTSLSKGELDLIEELDAIVRGDPARNSAPKIVTDARKPEKNFPHISKANGALLHDASQCVIPPPSVTSIQPLSAHRGESHQQRYDQSASNAHLTVSPTTAQTRNTVKRASSLVAPSEARNRPATRKPRKAAARVREVAITKTWEGTKSLGRTDRLTNAEKFALGVSHAASVGGVAVSLNLGIGREGMLIGNKDPKRRMMQTLNKHLGQAGFRDLPYTFVFEATPEEGGGRVHIHGAIDTSGLSRKDIDRLHMALRRAAGPAEGALGGQRQVDLTPLIDAAGWADYCLKATSRLNLELDIDDPFMINNAMRKRTRQHFDQLKNEVQDLSLADRAMRLQRRRRLKSLHPSRSRISSSFVSRYIESVR